MGKGAGDHQFKASPTISDLPIQTVDPAFSRTEPTLLKKLLENLYPLAEFTFLKKRNIGCSESHFGIINKSITVNGISPHPIPIPGTCLPVGRGRGEREGRLLAKTL